MKDSPPVRKMIRLSDFSYTKKGMYFITICTKNRIEILGKIRHNNIKLTKEGEITKEFIQELEKTFDNISINEYIIMPNHVHMLIEINKEKENISIIKIIKKYKSSISQRLGYSIWQKSYYDHIIRDEKEYYIIKKYIQDNIINWNKDKYF